MSDNSQKTPLSRSLNIFAEKKILDAIQLTGKALPCSVVAVSGSIITVEFQVNSEFTLPQVTIPMFGPEYVRYPTQIGDKGVVFPADARLGGVSGLGGGVADLSAPANLTALVFFPISNTDWSTVDPNAVTIYGPNGCVLRDTASNTVITLTPAGVAVVARDSFTIVTGACTLSLASSGAWSIQGTTGSLKDGTAHTSPAIMNAAWSAMVTYLNAHTHPANGAPPSAPFGGGNIAPAP